MKLDDYLRDRNITRTAFAVSVGITPGWVTWLCNGSGWPSRGLAERIAAATDGTVTANDFTRPSEAAE
jgi:3,4-dihydroxy 2-butanone 4-phosphate synthase/GTP cyclohydrolase II